MISIKSGKYRTHFCNEINQELDGEDITLSGWVHRKRDHGGLIFIDLRDHTGVCQLVVVPEKNELFETSKHVHNESVITVKGKVAKRSAETINHALPTGEFEILVNEFVLENDSLPSPFPIADDVETSEELRLKYRFLDLRKSRLRENIVFRSKLAAEIRKYLTNCGFIEIQTPILTSSSPEGARDFLVPSRIHPGHFYALPQAPQQFKQLLMVAGFDKYFQIAPCFRDEDSRADRSPGEFYQLDLEMSFIEQNDLFMLIESMFDHITKELSKKKIVALPFPQIAYRDSMDRFGTDKPDLRNPLEMIEVKDIFKTSTFKIFAENTKDGRTVKALVLKGRANESRMFYDKAEEKAKQLGLPGLAYIQFKDGGNKGPILKFMKEEELNLLKGKLKIETGDVVFFAAGIWERTCKIMGEMRSYFGKRLFEFDKNELAFCWIVDFPMYEYNEELKKIDFSHNPFSMPQGGLQALREKAPLDILAFQYDIVCNGIELSSGAIRNHKPEIMYKVFEIAGYSKADVDAKFGHMIRAFQHGAPPHGGIAPGFDRIVMIYRDEENLREVIPFPMNQKAQDLLMGAPSTVSEKQLTELHISIKFPPQKIIQKND